MLNWKKYFDEKWLNKKESHEIIFMGLYESG